MAEGIEFTRYFTHSSPCSPSRASLLTGRYLPGHGVIDNVIMPEHKELDPSMATLGSLLRGAGYRSSYIGKWHLSQSEHPDMEAYGFADWDGNDRHFMGWAGTGVHFDPIIASNAAQLAPGQRRVATRREPREPWFLTVALVNPHDVMWFPIDQPGYEERHPEDVASVRRVLDAAAWKDDDPLADLPQGLRRGRRGAPRQLPRRPPHQARGAPPVALGPATRAVGVHRPGRYQGLAAPPRLLRGAPAPRRRESGDGARAPSRTPARGMTPW